MPTWLTAIAWISLGAAGGCAVWIAVDCGRRRQPMAIMNVVWPVTALFGGPVLLWFYRRHGRAPQQSNDAQPQHGSTPPMPVAVAKGTLHCGAGCTVGDIVAETLAVLVPVVLVPLGYPGLFAERTFAVWILDFIFAFSVGIVFQYFTIAPMRELGVVAGLRAALKADALSLTCWQLGMYGVMAIALFGVYRPLLGAHVDATSPVFWFTMQVAMFGGFATSYPINGWLIRRGVKERM